MNRVGVPQMMSALTVAGDSVKNSAGENLGRIEDLVIDVQSGRVNYAVLSFGAFLGVAGKLFAVPWEALELDADARQRTTCAGDVIVVAAGQQGEDGEDPD